MAAEVARCRCSAPGLPLLVVEEAAQYPGRLEAVPRCLLLPAVEAEVEISAAAVLYAAASSVVLTRPTLCGLPIKELNNDVVEKVAKKSEVSLSCVVCAARLLRLHLSRGW